MTVDVNPPPQVRIPEAFLSDPDIRRFFEKQQQILFQLWRRTGGSNDTVSLTADQVTALEDTTFTLAVISGNYTTTGNQIIICNNTTAIDVTLEVAATTGTEVHIKRTNAVVDVIGTVDGQSPTRLNLRYYSMHLIHNGTNWSQI